MAGDRDLGGRTLDARVQALATGAAAGDTRRAMSQENVEAVVRIYDAFLGGDLAAMLAGLTQRSSGGRSRTRRPGTAIRGWRTRSSPGSLCGSTTSSRPRSTSTRASHVLVTTRLRGRGRLSGAEVEDQYFAVWTLRGGQAIAYREYTTRPEALDAVGLSGSPLAITPTPDQHQTCRFPRFPVRGFTSTGFGFRPTTTTPRPRAQSGRLPGLATRLSDHPSGLAVRPAESRAVLSTEERTHNVRKHEEHREKHDDESVHTPLIVLPPFKPVSRRRANR